MSYNNQLLLMTALLLSSGTVMAHVGDHHAMALGALIQHFASQPVHLLWLVPLLLLLISARLLRKMAQPSGKD